MKRFVTIPVLCLLFCTAFVTGRGQQTTSVFADSLRGIYLYTEGIKQSLIIGDTLHATQLFTEAIAADSTFAPAHYELASTLLYADTPRAIALSRRAAALDTTNTWYLQLYGQALVTGKQYHEAIDVYQRLRRTDTQDPGIYHVLAALYEQTQLPFSAIAVLDSAELRFGRIPLLSAAKRRLLVSTRQYDKAVTEAEAMVEAAPYEVENHVLLGELYGLLGRDSLAMGAFSTAMQIDSTNIGTLVTVADYYNRRQNYRSFLRVVRQIFDSDEVPAESKVEQFKRITADTRFYREFFFQINELASLLAVKYPNDPTVIELYGQHLIASGELDRALELYKHHTADRPPVKAFFTMVVDIESYKQRPDSVKKYITQAIRLFPDAPEFYIARGHIHSYGKRYDEAITSYRTSLKHTHSDSLRGVVWGYIGDTYHADGEPKKSYKAYDKSLGYYRDNAIVLNNYAYFLSEEDRDLERALDMSSRALALTENNPTYLDTHAWVLFKLGRTAEAKKSMQLAISLDRNNSPDLQLHYGDILAAAGERFMAEVFWNKALENGYADPDAIKRRFETHQETEKTDGQ